MSLCVKNDLFYDRMLEWRDKKRANMIRANTALKVPKENYSEVSGAEERKGLRKSTLAAVIGRRNSPTPLPATQR